MFAEGPTGRWINFVCFFCWLEDERTNDACVVLALGRRMVGVCERHVEVVDLDQLNVACSQGSCAILERLRLRAQFKELTDQELSARSVTEVQLLKKLNNRALQEADGMKLVRYPSSLMVNLCKRELERRGLSIPQVTFAE